MPPGEAWNDPLLSATLLLTKQTSGLRSPGPPAAGFSPRVSALSTHPCPAERAGRVCLWAPPAGSDAGPSRLGTAQHGAWPWAVVVSLS